MYDTLSPFGKSSDDTTMSFTRYFFLEVSKSCTTRYNITAIPENLYYQTTFFIFARVHTNAHLILFSGTKPAIFTCMLGIDVLFILHDNRTQGIVKRTHKPDISMFELYF